MRKQYLLLFLVIFLFMVNCSRNTGFDFEKQWTWQDLENYSQNPDTKKNIDYIKDKINLNEAYFLFRTISDFKAEDIQKLQQMELYQNTHGGSFGSFIPLSFNEPNKTPVPDTFDKTVELASYLALAKFMNNRSLFAAGIGYNPKFQNKELTDIERPNKKLDVDIKIDDFLTQIAMLKQKKFTSKDSEKIKNNKSISHMLASREEFFKTPDVLPTNENVADFIKITSEKDPVHKIWNWLNPMNNFGYSDLLNNIDTYEKTFSGIKENESIFKNRLLGPIENYLLTDVTYHQNIEFGVNFPMKSWKSDDYIGVNPVLMKDNYPFYFFELRKIIIEQLYPEIIIKSPNYDKANDTYENYWVFENEKDNEFYSIFKHVQMEGIKNFIAGKPLGFDFIANAKESRGFIIQIHDLIYKKRNDEMLNSSKKYCMGSYGPMTGLGYVMAKNISKEYGTETLAKCLYNGPIYFLKQYLEFQKVNKANYNHFFDDTITEKVNELYKIQEPYYLK